jgi:hypothetical protein
VAAADIITSAIVVPLAGAVVALAAFRAGDDERRREADCQALKAHAALEGDGAPATWRHAGATWRCVKAVGSGNKTQGAFDGGR